MKNPTLNMELRVELGSDLKSTLEDASRISNMMNVSVSFNFNGESFDVYPKNDIDLMYKNYFIKRQTK